MKKSFCAVLGALTLMLVYGCGGDDDDGGAASANACKDSCPAVVAADCAASPPSVEDCKTQCDAFVGASKCSSQYSALVTCSKGKQFVCSTGLLSYPEPEGCSQQQSDFIACYASM